MEMSSGQNGSSILWFFREKGFDDKSVQEMFRRCRRLETVQKERASENWAYLKSLGIQERKLPCVVTKCPKILSYGIEERLEPMVQCLNTLATKPNEVATAIVKFPYIFCHSVEEKLCPTLAFFEALGVPEKQLGKMVLANPRVLSYSIDQKLSKFVDFIAKIDPKGEGIIGKILVKNPFIIGYSVEKRLQPTVEFLRSLGLTQSDLARVAINYPEVLCRDAKKTLEQNIAYLKSCGFDGHQMKTLVTNYPPVLIKSIKNSLEPKIKFLVERMGRSIDEIVNCPDFFRYGLKKRLQFRQTVLTERNIQCSLSEMLNSNQKKFAVRYGLTPDLA
ncbi:hypothetical protein Dimus_036518 [Dionaea muscipula]